MRVFVTGCSGHVGSNVCKHLINCGYDVVGLSKNRSGIDGLAQHIQLDLGEKDFVDNVMKSISCCNVIIHAAAVIEKDDYSPEITLGNCLGMQNILKLAHRWNVKRFIYTSGITVIGLPMFHPITEDHPVDPHSTYIASKLFGEFLSNIANSQGLSTINLRLTAPVGPGMPDGRILSVFIKNAINNKPLLLFGKGERKQNYVDVRDVALIIEKCINNKVEGCFNIAGSRSYSNKDLAELCIKFLGSTSTINFTTENDPEDGINWDVSIDKARKYLGYEPKYYLEDSIVSLGAEYENCIIK